MNRPGGWSSHPLVLGGLVLVFGLQVLSEGLSKSPTFDEPAHIGAGFSYLKTGEFKVNLQHPPLLKEIGALPLLAMGAKFPVSQENWSSVDQTTDPFFQWQLGNQVLVDNGEQRVLSWSRAPFVVLALVLAGLIVAWGRRMLGGTAAACALLLFVFDPTIVAHAPLVATDSGMALFAVLFFFALWYYLNHRSLKRLLWCGLALGLLLASKFSAVILMGVAFVLLVWATRWIPAAVPRRQSTLVDPYGSEEGGQRLAWCLYAFLTMCAVAAVVLHALYLFPRNPFLYIEGIKRINADHDPGYWAFMAGHFKPRFLTYYVVAYLLKEPLPAILLAGIGTWGLVRRGTAPAMDRAFLLLPPIVLVAAYSLYSDNLGFRYMIPALPFLHLVGGTGLASLLKEGGVWRKAGAFVLIAWTVLAGTAIYPDHLSYFNETACLFSEPGNIGLDGGTRCGYLWLDDSNVDWGQGANQLKEWLAAHPTSGALRLGYFGSIRPEHLGIDAFRVTVEDLQRGPTPGTYVLSAHILARAIGRLRMHHGDGPENWLLHARPTAVIGHAYYVYDVPSGT